MTPTRLKLPIGIQTFATLRQDGCYYVDKTALALKLIEQGNYYFLSRLHTRVISPWQSWRGGGFQPSLCAASR